MPPRGVRKAAKGTVRPKEIEKRRGKPGRSTKRAEEIAARAVNKERARSGESRTSSRSSTNGRSASARGGNSPARARVAGLGSSSTTTPRKLGIDGRSKMSKKELQQAVAGAS